MRPSPAATSTPTTSAPRLDHRPRRLHLGSGPALCQGRLRLFRQQRDADLGGVPVAFALDGNHATATPSAPASNTCSRRTGRPRPSTVLQFRRQPLRRPGRAGAVRQLPQRRAHAEGRRQLSLQLRRARWSRATDRFELHAFESLQKAGFTPAFSFGAVFRFAENPAKGQFAQKCAKASGFPDLLTGYRDTAARGIISR